MFLVDNQSRNGTWLNDQAVPPGVPQQLRDGDRILLGGAGGPRLTVRALATVKASAACRRN